MQWVYTSCNEFLTFPLGLDLLPGFYGLIDISSMERFHASSFSRYAFTRGLTGSPKVDKDLKNTTFFSFERKIIDAKFQGQAGWRCYRSEHGRCELILIKLNPYKVIFRLTGPWQGERKGGARAPPEIFRFELNSATNVEFCLLQWKPQFPSIVDHSKIMYC